MRGGCKPLLIYDGDCRFCRYAVGYAREVTAGRVDYQCYQTAAPDFPDIDLQTFRDAIQLFESGERYSAAEATFRLLAIGGRPGLLWLYQRLPLFAWLSERAYHWVAAHRTLCYRIAHLCWGEHWRPLQYQRTHWLFFRGLGLIYLIAFASIGVQILGLVGSGGIAPLAPYLEAVTHEHGWRGYFMAPNLFWLSSSDLWLTLMPWAGAVSAVLLLVNVFPRTSLWLNYVFYLSLVHAGQMFTRYQWDILLLEVGVLAIVMSYWPRLGTWLGRWLLFRFVLLSGAVKLLSGDSSWQDLTALAFHFETQPLPTPLAWYFHHLPEGALQAMAALLFVIELGLPLLIFMPRYLRYSAAAGFTLLQVMILLTGSYNFFNLLTLLLCLLLLDDSRFKAWVPLMHGADIHHPPKRPHWILPGALTAVLLSASMTHTVATLRRSYPSEPWLSLVRLTQPFFVANGYGVFAVITRHRREIVIEGSHNGKEWLAYRFRYKPNSVMQRPTLATPHQPRLDWQLWFAALKSRPEPWFDNLLLRLLDNDPRVLALLAHNPFAETPPRYVRAGLYQYRFSTSAEKAATGAWWHRQWLGDYSPPLGLLPFDAGAHK